MPTAFPSISPVTQALSLISAATSESPEPTQEETRKGFETPASQRMDDPRPSPVRYHRLAEVRQQQGLSLRTISRRTGVEIKELRRQEDPKTNLNLKQLLLWQKALEVPLVDLLEDESDVLSRPVKERAQMVRIMKTVVSMSEVCQGNVRLTRLATMLREQLLQLMPELHEIGGWPQCGSRRGPDVMGRIFHEPIVVEFDGE